MSPGSGNVANLLGGIVVVRGVPLGKERISLAIGSASAPSQLGDSSVVLCGQGALVHFITRQVGSRVFRERYMNHVGDIQAHALGKLLQRCVRDAVRRVLAAQSYQYSFASFD